MRRVGLVCFLLLSGCSRVLVIEANAPPLVAVPELKAVAVGEFTTSLGTPDRYGLHAVNLLSDAIHDSPYRLVRNPAEAQLVVSGTVTCRAEPGRPEAGGRQIRFSTSAEFHCRTAQTRFTVTEVPEGVGLAALAAQFPDPVSLSDQLFRSCVRAFVADISPRAARIRVPEPGVFGDGLTRRGIRLLTTDPAAAIRELTAAVERNPANACALNALGCAAEIAGNLERALSCYAAAAARSTRAEHKENVERITTLLTHRRSILKTEEKDSP